LETVTREGSVVTAARYRGLLTHWSELQYEPQSFVELSERPIVQPSDPFCEHRLGHSKELRTFTTDFLDRPVPRTRAKFPGAPARARLEVIAAMTTV
jgi:hypothetical protein